MHIYIYVHIFIIYTYIMRRVSFYHSLLKAHKACTGSLVVHGQFQEKRTLWHCKTCYWFGRSKGHPVKEIVESTGEPSRILKKICNQQKNTDPLDNRKQICSRKKLQLIETASIDPRIIGLWEPPPWIICRCQLLCTHCVVGKSKTGLPEHCNKASIWHKIRRAKNEKPCQKWKIVEENNDLQTLFSCGVNTKNKDRNNETSHTQRNSERKYAKISKENETRQ